NRPHAKNLEFVEGDVRDAKALAEVVSKAQVIFHEAGQTAVTTSLVNPQEDFSVNALGTVNVLEAMRLHNPKAALIFASTNKVYGNLESFSLVEQEKKYVPQGIQ